MKTVEAEIRNKVEVEAYRHIINKIMSPVDIINLSTTPIAKKIIGREINLYYIGSKSGK